MTANEVSAIASAVAAIASCLAVMQATAEQRRRRRPHLFIQPSNVMQPDGGNLIRLRIENGGEGVARAVYFYAREGQTVCASGLPPDGLLAGLKGVTINTALTPGKSRLAEAVVLCRVGNRIHAWDAAGRHMSRTLRFPRLRRFSNETLVRKFYPDAPSIDTLTMVGYDVMP